MLLQLMLGTLIRFVFKGVKVAREQNLYSKRILQSKFNILGDKYKFPFKFQLAFCPYLTNISHVLCICFL